MAPEFEDLEERSRGTGRAMSTDGHEELYAMLVETSEEAPLEVLANCIEVMATVMNRRLHDLSSVVDRVQSEHEIVMERMPEDNRQLAKKYGQ